MKIGRASNLADLTDDNWRRFAQDIGVGLPYLRRRVAELSENVRDAVGDVCRDLAIPGLDAKALLDLGDAIARRAEIIASKLPPRASPRSD